MLAMNTPSNPNLSPKMIWLLTASLTALTLTGCGRDSTASKDASPTASAQTQAGDMTTKPDSPGPANNAGPGRKPCEYMNRADAEAAVGQPLPKTKENIPLGGCHYTSSDSYSYGADLTVGDWVLPGQVFSGIKAAATAGGPDHQPDTISGVGDEALYLDRPEYILYVRKANKGFMLSLHGPTTTSLPGTVLEQEKILALKILPNL
jgi:hypothetical protein